MIIYCYIVLLKPEPLSIYSTIYKGFCVRPSSPTKKISNFLHQSLVLKFLVWYSDRIEFKLAISYI